MAVRPYNCSISFLSTFLYLVFVGLANFACVPSAVSALALIHNFRMFRSTKKTLATIRVVSYNVLSPNLATPASYPTLNPDHLDPAKRLEAVLYKLEQELNQQNSVIVCLQEVSYDWAGSFHTFFANRGYHFVTGLYGRPFNGYMGVAMAWPTSSFETLDVDISRLSDTRDGGWPKELKLDEDEAENKKEIIKPCFSLFSWLFPKKDEDTIFERPPIEPWDYSKKRFNVMLTATLKDKETNAMFCIGTYHMPCTFYCTPVMAIHCEMAAYRVQQLAQKNHPENNNDNNRLPYIVAGDWNIKPQDSTYQLLTTGSLPPEDPSYPPPAMSKVKPSETLMTWEPRMQGMRSAYAVVNEQGEEPNFTNYAAPRSLEEEDQGFIDTLDYIFVSPEWKVVSTTDVPHRNEVKGPFPNLEPHVREPSDHILISADLEIDVC